MKKLLPLILLINFANAQLPETDIFLVSIKNNGGKYSFSSPENITSRKGYDNQPCFTTDNKNILYVAVADTTQSDIYNYDIKNKKTTQLTQTKESEYSPSWSPDKKHLSVVRVDADSGQRFYNLLLPDLKKPEFIKNSDSIGYFCWLNDSSVAMFILGPAHTLQTLNTKTSERKLIASDIGRCMKPSADKTKMFFIVKSNPAEWFIYSMLVSDQSLTRITQTLPGSEDFALMPDGKIIMGKEGKLYLHSEGEWKMIADFTDKLQDFYRITVSNDGTLLALVAFTGKKP